VQIYKINLDISNLIRNFASVKKKICFLVDSIFSIGGVQRVTAVIAKELAKDYDVSIFTFDKPEKQDTSLYNLGEQDIHYKFFAYPDVAKVKGFLCKVHRAIYIFIKSKSKWHSKLYARTSFPSEQRNTILPALQQGNFDVIIGVHAPLSERLATLKPYLPNTKLIGWLHNSYDALFGKGYSYIGSVKQPHFIYQFKKLEKVIVLCQNDAQLFTQFDQEFIPTVIYNPLTLVPGKPSNGNSKHFLAVGRFSYQHKGFDLLIKAFKIFSKDNKEWLLDIVGEGDMEFEYKALIKEYKLEDRIYIHPFTNNIQQYYSNAQVYVLSSRWEGMPLVLVEAMAHGLPIVTSDLPVCKEILGDFGMFFKNEDIDELAQRLEEATHIDWLQKSKIALEIANRYEVKPIVQQWKELIEG
jgi:glycosyltransferase involved in cell wall biosynthesis